MDKACVHCPRWAPGEPPVIDSQEHILEFLKKKSVKNESNCTHQGLIWTQAQYQACAVLTVLCISNVITEWDLKIKKKE